MCFDYIKTKGLKASGKEYKRVVDNLAKLSSFYEEDSGLRLAPDDIQYCMESSIIPIEIDNYTAPEFKEGPHYERPVFGYYPPGLYDNGALRTARGSG